ncbi:amino acid ABC transporter permease [Streptomyces sp. NPDC054802]
MAWDEWEQLKASAAGRHSTQMQLNKAAPMDEGGDAPADGGLQHSAKPWNRAASTAGLLTTGTNNAKTNLTKGHAGMAGGLTGLASLGSLKSVLSSWETRLGAVRDECESLEPKLRQVPKDLGGTDGDVGTKASAVVVPQGGDK